MEFVEKFIRGVVMLGAVGILSLVGIYAWYNTAPRRPRTVSPTAVYYEGLAEPFKVEQHGIWVICWFDQVANVDKCRNSAFDGRLVYEGVYVPYNSRNPIPQAELIIASKTMNEAQEDVEVFATNEESSKPGFYGIPLIYLENGNILIPKKALKEANARLEELERANSPYAPRRRSNK